MDKVAFIKLLKKEGYHVDDNKAIPTVLCSSSDYNSVIKAVKKIKSQSEYDESFSVRISALEHIHETGVDGPVKEPDIDVPILDAVEDDEVCSGEESMADKEDTLVTETKDGPAADDYPDRGDISSGDDVSDFFSVFDPFD